MGIYARAGGQTASRTFHKTYILSSHRERVQNKVLWGIDVLFYFTIKTLASQKLENVNDEDEISMQSA